jgi:hypothetical protein
VITFIIGIIAAIVIMPLAAMGIGGDKTLNRRDDERHRFNEQKRLYPTLYRDVKPPPY